MDLKNISIAKNIKTALQTPMPHFIHKQKPSGKTSLTYVSGQAVIDKLNATFGYAGWTWDILERFIQTSEPKMIKVKYENGKKVNIDPPIVESQLPVAHVIGKLTVYFERPDGSIHAVSKTAPGAQCLIGGQSEQENIFKGANTDALKKAATMFGIGLELYRDQNETQFFQELCYENPWTEEMLIKYNNELTYIHQYRANKNLDDNGMNTLMYQFSNGTLPGLAYLLPENIEAFTEYLKSLDNQTQPIAPQPPVVQ